MNRSLSRAAFTLVEILLVVVIIAILAGIVIIAVNPGRQISQTNNTERRAHVQSILNAVSQFATDNRGVLPAGIPAGTPAVVGSGAGQANICASLVPTYLSVMPIDVRSAGAHYVSCADYLTGYTVVSAGGRVTAAAPGAELGETISVTR